LVPLVYSITSLYRFVRAIDQILVRCNQLSHAKQVVVHR
jgi:hypothetical protein